MCDDEFIICTGGPDYWGNYDTDDCPCQLGYDREAIERMLEDDE
jgi:hypothetical protein